MSQMFKNPKQQCPHEIILSTTTGFLPASITPAEISARHAVQDSCRRNGVKAEKEDPSNANVSVVTVLVADFVHVHPTVSLSILLSVRL